MQAAHSIYPRILIERIGWLPITAIILRFATSATADSSYLLLAIFALTGRVQAIQALALSWLFTMLSPGVAPSAQYASISRYIVFLGAAVSILIRSNFFRFGKAPDPLVGLTLMLGAFMTIHSLFFSPIPDVSILKALSWTVVMVTLLAAWSRLSMKEAAALESWLYAGLVLIMLASLPLLVLPVGFLRNSTGFQGMLSHPQAFGATMAILAALTVGRMMAYRPPPLISIGISVLCLSLVIMSETRTAVFAVFIALAAGLIGAPMIAGRSIRTMAPALRTRRFQGLIFAALLASIAFGPQISDLANNFISKSGRSQATGLFEAYADSRGGKIDVMWENIKENPWSGVGFGIASELEEFEVMRDPILNLPIGAAIEKGVLPVMVLEELGILGLLLTLSWVWLLIRRAALRGIASFAFVAVALLLNFGEAVLFSPGGFGLLILLMLSWGAARPLR